MMVLEKRISGELPIEIIEEILLRSPVKTLVKLRSVCKSWNSLITTSAFIYSHLRRNQNKIILIKSTLHERLYHDERQRKTYDLFAENYFSLRWDHPPFDVYSNYKDIKYNPLDYKNPTCPKINVVGTCNGLVCIVIDHNPSIWNPCIKRHVMLPIWTRCQHDIVYHIYGFGYDSLTNDYKVLGVRIEESETLCDIWSLAKPYWKRLDAAALPVPVPGDAISVFRRSLFVQGAVHWFYRDSIVMLDMSSELFGEMTLPAGLRKQNSGCSILSRYGNSVACFEVDYRDKQFDMWVMEEYGVAESWVKLLAVELPQGLGRLFGFRNNGEIVISCDRGSPQLLLNPKTKDIGEFRAAGFVVGSYDFQFIEPFVESLVLLDQPDAISSL